MAIYENMLEQFSFLEKTHAPDGEGGYISAWNEGVSFQGVATVDSTLSAVVAGVTKGVVSYAVYTPSNITLEYGDVIKRASDGLTFKITEAGATPPPTATIRLRKNQAVAWEVPK